FPVGFLHCCFASILRLSIRSLHPLALSLFPSNACPTTHTHTLSLHDALPIFSTAFSPQATVAGLRPRPHGAANVSPQPLASPAPDRKSTRLNSSHQIISYAVFCLKKKIQDYNLAESVLTHKATERWYIESTAT